MADDALAVSKTRCEVCGSTEDEATMLLCDGCDGGHHLKCVGLRTVPSGEWFCSDCTQPLECSTAGLENLDLDIKENIMTNCRKSPKFYALLNFWRNFGDPLLVPMFDSLDLEFALASPRRENIVIKIVTRLLERGKPDPELKLTRWEIQLALLLEQRFKKYEANKAKKIAADQRTDEQSYGGDGMKSGEIDSISDMDISEETGAEDGETWGDEMKLVLPLEQAEDMVIQNILNGTNPLENCSFASASLESRINVLLALCEWKLEDDPWLREVAATKDDGPSCRGEPFGWDNQGRCYFAEGMGSPRIFRERRRKLERGYPKGADAQAWGFDMPELADEEEDCWETVVVNINEMFRLVGTLRSGKGDDRYLYKYLSDELVPAVLQLDADDSQGKDRMDVKRKRQHDWEVRSNKYNILARRKSARVEAQELIMREEEDRFLQRELDRIRKAEAEKKLEAKMKKRGIDTRAVASRRSLEDKESGWGAVGRKIRTFWIDQQKWFTGKIISFNPRTSKHTIQYDEDGNNEEINIAHVKIKFLDDDADEYEGSDVDEKEYTGLEAIGRRVKILWDDDKTWYGGRIINYRRATRAHTILYDLDGSTEDVDLSTVQMKFVKDKQEKGKTGPTGLPVGHKLLVVSDFDRCWYQAKVAGYDAGLNMHCLVMDGGYEELVNLNCVRWVSSSLASGENLVVLSEENILKDDIDIPEGDCMPCGVVIQKPSWLLLKHAFNRQEIDRTIEQNQPSLLTIKAMEGGGDPNSSEGKIPKLIIAPASKVQVGTTTQISVSKGVAGGAHEMPPNLSGKLEVGQQPGKGGAVGPLLSEQSMDSARLATSEDAVNVKVSLSLEDEHQARIKLYLAE